MSLDASKWASILAWYQHEWEALPSSRHTFISGACSSLHTNILPCLALIMLVGMRNIYGLPVRHNGYSDHDRCQHLLVVCICEWPALVSGCMASQAAWAAQIRVPE